MLDPQVQSLINQTKALGLPPVYTLPIKEARQRMRDTFVVTENICFVEHVEEYIIPGITYDIPVRVYKTNIEKGQPCLLFFHGGGWTLNDLDTHDSLCRDICNGAKCTVISVDYRLAPEHKFPAAIEDAYSSLCWIFDNYSILGIDKYRIAVGGDSSGAYQAIVVCQHAKKRNGPKILFQWLAYPVTNYYFPENGSYIEMAAGYSLNRDFMVWFWHNYLPKSINTKSPYISPLQEDDLTGQPATFIQIANYDPLRDEGLAYANKLKQNNVNVKCKLYNDQMHGFLMIRKKVDHAQIAFEDVLNELNQVFKN